MKTVKNILKRCSCFMLVISAVIASIPPVYSFAAETEKKTVHVGLFEDTYYKVRDDGQCL